MKIDILGVFIVIFAIALILALVIYLINSILKSPFKYPYYVIIFDVTGKRSPNINDLIDKHLNKNGFNEFANHYETVNKWKIKCENSIKKSKLKKLRTRQFEAIIDDENMFCFKLQKKQTRYKQVNYVRTPYCVKVIIAKYSSSFDVLQKRFDALKNIGFECTLSEYHSKEQRKKVTPALREKIALRDNYTCRHCGKYMPDGVGLQIDHIIPIAKGGKSMESNLQVLCSKCNGKKSSKL